MAVAHSQWRLRWHFALLASAVVAAVACGTGRVRSAATSPTPPAGVRVFGDTARYGLRLVSLDAVDESASVTIARPAHVIVLGVRPGREIELISYGPHRVGTIPLSLRRFEERSPEAVRDADVRASLEYERCTAAADAAARQRVRDRTQRRDSTGKVIQTGGDPLPTPNYAACRKPAPVVAKPRRLPPREPAERYLVVLASAEPLSATLLEERLATLTAVAPDVATTIEAIAAGLLLGIHGTTAGTYVAWH